MGTRFPFTSYPRGWFVIALSDDIAAGEVKTLHYFGRDIVVFRTESGVLSVTDPTCPHLGAHLGGGKVQGECLRCPFHDWAFAPEGECKQVPYAPKIPPKAKLNLWESREHNGVIMVWFCPTGGAPQWEPPVLEEEGWTANQTIRWEVKTHPQEVAENTVDCAHLGPVHEVSRTEVRALEQEGPYMRVLLHMVASGAAIGMPDEINDVDLDVDLFGLGQLVADAKVLTAGLRSRNRIHSTPIDEERIAIFGIVNTFKMADEEYTREIADIFYAAFCEDFPKDFPIWENKRYLEKPMLAGGDGPIPKYRKWCKQFYDAPEVETDLAVSPEPAGLMAKVVSLFKSTPKAQASSKSADSKKISLKMVAEDGKALAVARGFEIERKQPGGSFDSVSDYFDTLPARFDPSVAGKLEAVFQWDLTGEGARAHHAIVREGQIECVEGKHAEPTVTITMTADDYLKMINGELNGAKAFSTGRGKLRGPVRLAMKMQKLFPLERQV